jgi:hypothetical protein
VSPVITTTALGISAGLLKDNRKRLHNKKKALLTEILNKILNES